MQWDICWKYIMCFWETSNKGKENRTRCTFDCRGYYIYQRWRLSKSHFISQSWVYSPTCEWSKFWNVIVLKGTESEHLAVADDRSPLDTWCMEGREEGSLSIHFRTRLAANTKSWTAGPAGGASLLSKTSSRCWSNAPASRHERNSWGYLPTRISNATIPKLYTSHFFVTFIVKASSAKHKRTKNIKEQCKYEIFFRPCDSKKFLVVLGHKIQVRQTSKWKLWSRFWGKPGAIKPCDPTGTVHCDSPPLSNLAVPNSLMTLENEDSKCNQ